MAKEKSKLFKDKFDKYSAEEVEANRIIEDFEGLNDAISKDLEHRLHVLLCGIKLKDLIEISDKPASSSRRYHEEQSCSGEAKGIDTEPKICKCMFYFDRQNKSDEIDERCNFCPIEYYWTSVDNRFKIIDYELPMPYEHTVKWVKRVDLVLKDCEEGNIYAVEVKRYQSKETLSRMMAEALTYTAVLETGGTYGMKENKKLLPAIAFFEGSEQHKRYERYKNESEPLFLNLLKEIKVFLIKVPETVEKKKKFVFELLN